jgi:hypothetical protein
MICNLYKHLDRFHKCPHPAAAYITAFGADIVAEIYLKQLGRSGGQNATQGCTVDLAFTAAAAHGSVKRAVGAHYHFGAGPSGGGARGIHDRGQANSYILFFELSKFLKNFLICHTSHSQSD